jgi:hypothetical protein
MSTGAGSNLTPPSAAEELIADMEAAAEQRAAMRQTYRDRLTADFKAGKIGIENGWLVEYNEPCASPCAGPYGCPPSCDATPIMDLTDGVVFDS